MQPVRPTGGAAAWLANAALGHMKLLASLHFPRLQHFLPIIVISKPHIGLPRFPRRFDGKPP